MFFAKRRVSPKDSLRYIIPEKAIEDSQRVLQEYSEISPPNEGLLYWAGIKDDDIITILSVIVPNTVSTWNSVSTSNRSNFDVVVELGKKKQIHVGQIHSHPGDWVDHSDGDDKYAPFKVEGLISIIVPNYCKRGFLPLTNCGVHIYDNGKFFRFSDDYISRHFVVTKDNDSNFVDLRK